MSLEVKGVKEVKRRILSFGVSSLTSKATKELCSILMADTSNH